MSEQMYPCRDCGKLRTKDEGGTTFTVCDECWDKHALAKANDEPWDRQRKAKYRDHDIVPEDFKERDYDAIREAAVTLFKERREGDNVKLIVTAFMGFLTSREYRITKKEDTK